MTKNEHESDKEKNLERCLRGLIRDSLPKENPEFVRPPEDDILAYVEDRASGAQSQAVQRAMTDSASFQEEIYDLARAAENLSEENFEQRFAAVDIPFELRAQPGHESDQEPGFLQRFQEWIVRPKLAYAAAACALLLGILFGPGVLLRTASSPTMDTIGSQGYTIQSIVLQKRMVTRGPEPDEPIATTIELAAGSPAVDLQIREPVNPLLPIRFRAILECWEDSTLIAFNSDNRRFQPAANGMAYPTLRVESHLLSECDVFELRFEPIRQDGTKIENSQIQAYFKIGN